MSDRKYRTMQQLENDVRYNRRMQNTHKLRADAAQEEIDRRRKEGASPLVVACRTCGAVYPKADTACPACGDDSVSREPVVTMVDVRVDL